MRAMVAIYNIFDFYEKIHSEKILNEGGPRIDPEAFKTNQIDENFIPASDSSNDRLFSALAARLFFFLLLIADLIWSAYSLLATLAKFSLCVASFFQIRPLKKSLARSYLSLTRAVVCALALFIALFSPA